tara:strand:- start:719 stop:1348 length:630 start_codon:yes stop_codon:yes gene_type:complete
MTNIELNGISMLPTYQNEESVFFLNKRDNRIIQRGDVVRADKFTNSDPNKQYVKRVVGIPGDNILLHINGYVFSVNGEKSSYSKVSGGQSYLYQTDSQKEKNANVDFDLIPKDELYKYASFGTEFEESVGGNKHLVILLIGGESESKRDYIEHLRVNVATRDITFNEDGLAKIKVPKNSYFLMSDNRPIGVDSRHFGFVRKNDISAILP